MTESILEYALGNTLLAAPLAAVAWAIGRSRRHPSLAHFMWVLVLVRLAMPPISAVPWLSLALPVTASAATVPAARAIDAAQETAPQATAPAIAKPSHDATRTQMTPDSSASRSAASGGFRQPLAALSPWLAAGALWIAGTALIVAISAARILRFARGLRASCRPASPEIVAMAHRAATDLAMPMRAEIRVTSAATVPFVWAFFGRPAIVLPSGVVAASTALELRLILAHELAHIRRGDHLVRWLDWAVVAWLWWNPLAWVARRGLRATEELACDSLVLRTRGAAPREYGSCLLAVAESLSGSAFRAPVQACTMGDGGSLEQRIRFIMSGLLHRRPSLSARIAITAVAAVSMAASVACVSVSTSSQGATPAKPDAAPAASAPANPKASQDGAHERTLQTSLDDPKSLDVDVENGSITVVRDDSLKSMQVTVVVGDRSDSRSDSDSHRAAVQGATLVAERDSSGQVTVRVKLPGLGIIRSNPPSTKVTVRTPGLSSVRAESMNGSIRTEGDLGELALETTNGSIDAAGAASVVAKTTNGSVEISGATASARAETMNGKIRIAVPEGSKAVIDAESVNGGITLEIPASWDGAIDASTTLGRLRITDIDGTTTPDMTGATFRREAASGSPAKAKLDVTNGSITLKRP